MGRWRAARAHRAADRRAVRSEFELARPWGLAAWRALAASVGELERERIRSHAAPAPGAAASRARAVPR